MIFEFLKIGEENAFSPEYIKTSLGFSSIRAVQKQIERERADGKVILSSAVPPGGDYLPSNKQEIRRIIKTLENRAKMTLGALDSAKKMLNELEIEEE